MKPVRVLTSAAGGAKPDGAAPSQTVRLLPLLIPVTLAGAAVLAAAVTSLALSPPTLVVLAGIFALFGAATLGEAYPVPVESLPAGYVSLAAVFVVGTGVVYGWAPAVCVAFVSRATIEIVQRRPLIRMLYNGGVYALAGAAAGGAIELARAEADTDVGLLLLGVFAGAAAFYVVNVLLIAAVIARWAGEPFFSLLRTSAYWTIVPFAIMASVSLMLAVLWERSPLLSAALVGPLLAVALYQRSVHRALAAMRLALTDALTGLGNQRHFHERLEHALDAAEQMHTPVTLCVLDVDDLKRVNDTYGHPVGDQVLVQVASCLRHGGEAFRVGGDEFALILPGRDERAGVEIAEAVLNRLSAIEAVPGDHVGVSVGLASYPEHTSDRSALYRLADDALYGTKGAGKNALRVYRPALERNVSVLAAGSGFPLR